MALLGSASLAGAVPASPCQLPLGFMGQIPGAEAMGPFWELYGVQGFGGDNGVPLWWWAPYGGHGCWQDPSSTGYDVTAPTAAGGEEVGAVTSAAISGRAQPPMGTQSEPIAPEPPLLDREDPNPQSSHAPPKAPMGRTLICPPWVPPRPHLGCCQQPGAWLQTMRVLHPITITVGPSTQCHPTRHRVMEGDTH